MNGLEQIISINRNAAALAEDKARQAKGLKPKTVEAAIYRKSRSATNRKG
jgi:hypothetical protein